MKEIWKNIKDYDGLYQVSNLGNIKNFKNNKILNGYYDKDGYKRICLYNKGKRYYPFVHRIVAETFIPNPDNLPCINHKNEIKDDNVISNLEWCTIKYNNNYGNRNKKISINNRKKVAQYSLNMNLIKKFNSITEASKEIKTSTSHISGCCKGKYKTVKGYIWKYI